MAAKKKPNPFNVLLSVRVTKTQRKRLDELAVKEGYQNISEAIRALADAPESKPSSVSSNEEA
jgi:Arc/MetJ-type ribon-helix-helix transcriptional regulator